MNRRLPVPVVAGRKQEVREAILSSQVIGMIETDAVDAAVIFRELPPGRLPSNRSRRLGDLYTRRWPTGGEFERETQFECVAADIDRLRADLEAEFASLMKRFPR